MVVCPGTLRCVDKGSDTTAAVKAAKYVDQYNFITFLLETGGRETAALDTLTAPRPEEEEPSQDVRDPRTLYGGRTTTETDLREAMQVLVRVQAQMPARIVVEICSTNLAVDVEP